MRTSLSRILLRGNPAVLTALRPFTVSVARCSSVQTAQERAEATVAAAQGGVAAEEAQMQRVERTMRRFWKTASITEPPSNMKGQYAIALDGRHIKTPGLNKLLIPKAKRSLALMLAAEWDAQTKVLKPHALPLTSLVSRAIDAFHPATTHDPTVRSEVISRMLSYLDTDTILYHQEYPDSLVALQERDWVPLLDWARREHNIEIVVTTGMVATRQPEETRARLRLELETMDPIELSAFERACMTSKSFLVALALVKRAVMVEEAARAAQVEVNSQIQRWGMVEDRSVACAVMAEK
ncbi:hypothetical protein BC938DRAFT_478044 [Jimgerdemannia flammicorona]|uniref:ATP12-domain-containing protein n=1 Tax=Jimgerdemannia flammicorona TaxID=994334 RepID=A0A433QYM8_9FUNG|nr:hypothetical protein BC938DRAFT_478044 [Jimgerdemannia flammicorona]